MTGTTLSSFNVHVSKLVPAIFAKFPNYNEVLIVGRGKFTNIRGNSSEGDVASALFTRKNAETIKWDNISLSNIPKLADAYGVHPSLRK